MEWGETRLVPQQSVHILHILVEISFIKYEMALSLKIVTLAATAEIIILFFLQTSVYDLQVSTIKRAWLMTLLALRVMIIGSSYRLKWHILLRQDQNAMR